jgi:TorA maturation chaperone TorD
MNEASVTMGITQGRWVALPAEARAALVRSDLYRALGWSFLYPDATLRMNLAVLLDAIGSISADLSTHRESCASVERLERFGDASTDRLRCEFDAVFGHTISADCPPYETQYGAGIIFAQTQRMGDITGFYRAFGVQLSPSAHERHDHIAAELEFMSVLAFREATAIIENGADCVAAPRVVPEHQASVRDAERKFLVEHLAPWSLSFAERLARKSAAVAAPDGGFYAALAACLGAMIRDELSLFQLTPQSVGHIAPARIDFEPEGCSFACGAMGEPVLDNLPGFNV